MGLHHQSSHGRVFRGLDAKNHLEMEKRDSHGSHIRLNVPAHLRVAARPADAAQTGLAAFQNKAVTSEDVATYTSVVYMTVSADFTGEIAGYTTLSDSSSSSPTPTNSHESAYAAQKSAATARGQTTIVSTVSPTSSAATDDGSNNKSMFLNPPTSAIVGTTASSTFTAAALGGTPLTQTRGATAGVGTPISATRAPIAQEGHPMSSGAKAGLAIGILLAITLAAGLLCFCWRRRRNPNSHQELVGGKRASSSSSFFGGKAMSEKHVSVSSEHSTRTATTAPRLSLRPVTQFLPMLGGGADNRKSTGNHLDVASAAMSEKPKSMWERRSQNSQNPFEDANVISEKQARPESPPANPFEEPEGDAESFKPSVSVETAAAVPVAAANVAPTARGPNNVHRVQLDFKPSMEDELELKSGQLVRMLHEYDDGWALCIRMDRTQQGVAPRTCLSKLPVKPRPQGPPPPGQNGRPMSPGMSPRPLTPNGRERSDSNPAIPARKPVPGQAL